MRGRSLQDCIPLSNMMFMLAYAWDLGKLVAESEKYALKEAGKANILVNSFLRIIEKCLSLGLPIEYEEHQRHGPSPSGAMDIFASAQQGFLERGQVVFRVDEIKPISKIEAMISGHLEKIYKSDYIESILQKRALALYKKLGVSSSVPWISAQRLWKERVPQTRIQKFVVELAALLETQSLPFFRDDRHARKMSLSKIMKEHHIFEKFCLQFWKQETSWKAQAESMSWAHLEVAEKDKARMPTMRTDIVLSRNKEVIIADAKFYRCPFSASHRGRHSTLRSGHIFQIFSYTYNYLSRKNIPLDNLVLDNPKIGQTTKHNFRGMLLYASVKESFIIDFKIDGICFRAASVPLAGSWADICERMHSILLPGKN